MLISKVCAVASLALIMRAGGTTALADTAPSAQTPAPAGIIAGEPLIRARIRLLAQGWQPVGRHASDGYEYSGAELQLTRRKLFEVDACSSDSARCILYYQRRGACLRLDTIGEQYAEMKVTRWVRECPEPPSRPGRATTTK